MELLEAAAPPFSTALTSTSSLWPPNPYANIQQRQCVDHSMGLGPGIGDSTTMDTWRPVKDTRIDTWAPLCCTGL